MNNRYSVFNRRIIFFLNKLLIYKIDIAVFIFIFSVVFYAFSDGWLSIDKYVTDLSEARIECRNNSKKMYFFRPDGAEYYSARKSSNCMDVANNFEGRKLIAYHSSSGIIHKLIVDGKVGFSISKYIYIVPYTFLFFGLFLGIRKKLEKRIKPKG